MVNLAPINDAPVLVGETIAFAEDNIQTISQAALLANDTDVDNPHSALRIIAVGNATHGTIGLNPDGSIRFAPDADYFGPASFSYTVSDGVGGTSQASVNLTFNPVNDAPVANSELVFGKRDVSYTLSQAALLANDTDVESPGNLRVGSISNVQHGAATLNSDGSVRFVPTAGHAGRGSFDYTVLDADGGSSTATAQIDFSRINTSPITTNDSFTGYEDIPFSITAAQLLVNDRDDDNASSDLRIAAVSGATNGTVSLQADGGKASKPGLEGIFTPLNTHLSQWIRAQIAPRNIAFDEIQVLAKTSTSSNNIGLTRSTCYAKRHKHMQILFKETCPKSSTRRYSRSTKFLVR